MDFNSLEFLIFLPVVVLLHWLLPHRFRWALLLAASWLFYFWWDFWTGFLLVLAILVSWLCAREIARTSSPVKRKAWAALALCVCFGCLGVFKYAGFFAGLLGADLALGIILPVGISFYTFQALSYVLDVYRGRVPAEGHFGHYALFVSFFPQLVAGPIERPEALLPQLQRERIFSPRLLASGGWLLMLGYFKKVVIADGLAPLVDRVYGAPEAALGPEIAAVTVLFGIQIYCDFSGYSDIARGAARLLGVELMENFRAPYAARSIRAFWRRWHISLTSWFTDYVYIPLGGSRVGTARRLRNVMAVFLLSGLWHGADLTFVLWGGIHGLYLCAGILRDRLAPPRPDPGPLAEGLRWLGTFLLVSITWLPFRAEDLAQLGLLLSRLPVGWEGALQALAQGAEAAVRAAMLLLCLAAVDRLPDRPPAQGSAALPVFCCVTAIALGWLVLLSGSGQNAFIYFRF